MKDGLKRALVSSVLVAFASSCTAKKTEPLGELMLAIQTDMEVPKDLDTVWIEITVYGNTLFKNSYDVGPDGLHIPATLGLVAGKDPAQPVTIRVTGVQDGKSRMLREVITTVPPDRIALLRVPISWVCDGTARETQPEQYESTCGDGQSCIAGTCASSVVDVTTLPDFRPRDIYGGADDPSQGTCIDVVTCFATGMEVPVQMSDCTISAPTGATPNVALVLPLDPVDRTKSDGLCGDGACLIPLDANSSEGWLLQGTRAKLPDAVCKTILPAGRATGVAVTTACASKDPGVPPCGPWSTVQTTQALFVGPPPAKLLDGGASDGATPDSSIGCLTNQISCGGVCVPVGTTQNCAYCGNACGPGMACDSTLRVCYAVACGVTGASCFIGTDCCSGLCPSGTCVASTDSGFCGIPGALCVNPVDCCTFNCADGTCG